MVLAGINEKLETATSPVVVGNDGVYGQISHMSWDDNKSLPGVLRGRDLPAERDHWAQATVDDIKAAVVNRDHALMWKGFGVKCTTAHHCAEVAKPDVMAPAMCHLLTLAPLLSEEENNHCETPLHYAALNPDDKAAVTALKTLVAHGALRDHSRLNSVGTYKCGTPLHNAALSGNPKAAYLLLSWGADPRIKNERWDHRGSKRDQRTARDEADRMCGKSANGKKNAEVMYVLDTTNPPSPEEARRSIDWTVCPGGCDFNGARSARASLKFFLMIANRLEKGHDDYHSTGSLSILNADVVRYIASVVSPEPLVKAKKRIPALMGMTMKKKTLDHESFERQDDDDTFRGFRTSKSEGAQNYGGGKLEEENARLQAYIGMLRAENLKYKNERMQLLEENKELKAALAK